MVQYLAQSTQVPRPESNSHSAGQKHPSLSSVLLAARPRGLPQKVRILTSYDWPALFITTHPRGGFVLTRNYYCESMVPTCTAAFLENVRLVAW